LSYGADNGATHPAADATHDNSESHEVLQKAKIGHRLLELEVGLGHRRERQTQIAAARISDNAVLTGIGLVSMNRLQWE
jgi:hypothetical protein